MSIPHALQQLIGAEISSVVFVRDYFQLVFERHGQTRKACLSIHGRNTLVQTGATT